MPKLFEMISAQTSIILSPQLAEDTEMAVDSKLITSWRKYNGKTYLLVLNASGTTVNGAIDTGIIPGAKKAVNLQDKSVFQLQAGKLHDELKAFQFKIYQVTE